MSRIRSILVRRPHTSAAAATVFAVVIAAAHPARAAEESAAGRIDFSAADLPPAAVEVDLSRGMLRDMIGLGDAAVAGAAETLLQSADAGQGGESTRMAAEQLAALRKITQLAGEVVQEARIRAYRGLAEQDAKPDVIAAKFDDQLSEDNWDKVVRARENNQTVRVALLRNDGAVRGIFVIAGQGQELVLVNVVCDISPENIKNLTAAATKIGLENGLAQAIDAHIKHRHHRRPPNGEPAPPNPPRPPKPEHP
jgi:hypothetical protein